MCSPNILKCSTESTRRHGYTGITSIGAMNGATETTGAVAENVTTQADDEGMVVTTPEPADDSS